jgi:hypothetical protein
MNSCQTTVEDCRKMCGKREGALYLQKISALEEEYTQLALELCLTARFQRRKLRGLTLRPGD